MRSRTVETNVAVWADRHLPPSAIADQVKAIEASGVVDGILLADQLGNFIPPELWTAQNTPMAAVLRDPDSHSDVFVMAGYLLASARKLHLTVSTDSVRRPPAELVQAMLTLANITEGHASFHIGGGEAKQCKPFGHKRSEGMSRMEDLFRIFRAFWESDGPIDFEGRRWTFEKASIGAAKPYRPRLYGLGGGPQLIDHATSYADGLAFACPSVWPTAERFAAAREDILRDVERKGRNPEQFGFAVWFPVMLAGDQRQLEAALDNPIVRWLGAVFGRIDPRLWKEDGLASPLPEDWRYYEHFLPQDTPQSFIDGVLAAMTREHVTKGWLCGTPAAVAALIQPYVDAGADWVCPMDYMPLVLDPTEGEAAFRRTVELCGAIKGGLDQNPRSG